MHLADALQCLIAAQPITIMIACFMAGIMATAISRHIHKRNKDKALTRKDVQDILRRIRYYEQKPSEAAMSVTAPDKKAYKSFRPGDVTPYVRLDNLMRATEQAWFNEACRTWLQGEKPLVIKRYRTMPLYARPICRDAFRYAVHEMPKCVTVILSYRKPNGKTSKPKKKCLSTDDMTEWLQAASPGIEPVKALGAMRRSGFRCACCGARLDECGHLMAYDKGDGAYEARCPGCMFKE